MSSYMLNWYISKQELDRMIREDVKIIVGNDCSEGLGRDQMTLVFLDEQTLETVGALCINEVVSSIHFSNYICKLMIKYPNLILVPERKSLGMVVIEALLIQLPAAGIDPFRRIFNRAVQEMETIPDELKHFINTPLNRRLNTMYERYKGYFGYATAGSGTYSRKNLYELVLPRLSNYAANDVRDPNLVDELMGLVVDSKGRIDHTSGGHDDHVIAWLLAGWLLCFGRNLSFYGITNPMIKVTSFKEKNKKQVETRNQLHDRKRQDNIRQTLANYIKKLSVTESDMEAIAIEKQIRHLSSKLTYSSKLPLSIDELMKEANNQRKSRMVSRRSNTGRF